MKVSVILPAAGLGTRMGRHVADLSRTAAVPETRAARPAHSPEKAGTSRKQFMLLDGVPILVHTVRKFVSVPAVAEIIIALRGDDLEWVRGLLEPEMAGKQIRLVEGGDSRQQSVENALVNVAPDVDVVAVHDAVRPFIEPHTLDQVFQCAAETGAAIVGIVPIDTVKQVHKNKVRATLPRERLVLAQTPQAFHFDLLRQAFELARRDNFTGTDESSLVERLEQVEVTVVPGTDRNIKITKPSDMELARLFLSEEMAARVAS